VVVPEKPRTPDRSDFDPTAGVRKDTPAPLKIVGACRSDPCMACDRSAAPASFCWVSIPTGDPPQVLAGSGGDSIYRERAGGF
jgi:hypothetical protein